MKQNKLWAIIEWDENVLDENPTLHTQLYASYDEAWKNAKKKAKSYKKERGMDCKLTEIDDEGRIELDVFLGQYHYFAVNEVKLPTEKKAKKKPQKVTVIDHGVSKDWPSAKEAIKFYELGVACCDPNSAECIGYNSILRKLRAGDTLVVNING